MIQNRVTQKLIAEQLNLSVATVSKALSGHSDVNAETHTKVINMATRLGYSITERLKPTTDEQKLEKHHLIGIFVQSDNDPWQRIDFFAGMSKTYAKMNISLLFHYSSPDDCKLIISPQYQPPALRENLLSGAILVNQWPENIVSQLATKVPCVSIIHEFQQADIDVIGIDEQTVVSSLMRHLCKLGHQKIGFLANGNPSTQEVAFYAAYVASSFRLGLDFDPQYVIGITGQILDDNAMSMDLQVKKVVEQVRRGVRAWMCTSNQLAYELYWGLMNRGYKIPEDISITGFGETIRQSVGRPKLTCMEIPVLNIGAEAVRRVLNRLRHPTSPKLHVKLQCKLVQGETTAKPGK